MCVKRRRSWALAICLLGMASLGHAQERRMPQVCRDPRSAAAQLCRGGFDPNRPRSGEMRQAPPGDMQRSPRQYGESYEEMWDRRQAEFIESVPEPIVDETRDLFYEGMGKANPRMGKSIKKVTDPGGYAMDEGLNYIKRKLPDIPSVPVSPRFPSPWLIADIVTEPIPNPKGYMDGQSRRHPDVIRPPMVEDAVRNGRCVPREMLYGPMRPFPGPAPTLNPDCASVEEMMDYASRHQREFEAIAAQERLTWNDPSDNLRDLDDMIRYAERLMNNPALSADDRILLKDALSDLRSSRKKKGDRGLEPSPPIPFMNDRIHQSWQDMDSKMSIQPWH